MAHDVFISYASEDKIIADAVCAGMEKEGIRCWIAPRDILPSENYDDAIIKGIIAARVMVVIFSSNIFQSQFVKSEVERGFSKGLIIAPFRIENVTPEGGLELYLGRRHWLDALTPPLEAHIHTLAVTVRSMLAAQPAQPAAEEAKAARPAAQAAPEIVEKQRSPQSVRPAWMAVGALAGVGVVGGLCLIALVVLLIRYGPGSQHPAAGSPSQPAGMPTQANIPAAVIVPTSAANPIAPAPATTAAGEASAEAPSFGAGSWLLMGDLPRSINAFTADPLNPKTIYAATGDYTGAGAGVYRSEDSGLSWKNVSRGLPPESVLSIGVFSQPSPFLIASVANKHDLYTSTDQGTSWTYLASMPGGGSNKIVAFFSNREGKRLFALVLAQGIYASENNGQTWNPLGEGLPTDPNWGPLVQSLAFDPSDPQMLYAGTGGPVGQGQGVFKSTDGGETWAPANKGMLDFRITALAVDPRQPLVVYAGSDQGDLFKSSDAGQSWTNLKERLKLSAHGEPRHIRSLQFDPTNSTFYLLGDNSGMLVSTNGGEQWKPLGNPPGVDQPTYTAWGIILGEKTVILVAADSSSTPPWRYSDDPAASSPTAAPAVESQIPTSTAKLSGTWQALAGLPREVNVMAVDPANPKLIFAGTGDSSAGGVYKSEDGGLTWKDSSAGLNNHSVIALAFSAGEAHTVYAACGSGDEIYASQDQGQTWAPRGKTGTSSPFWGGLFVTPQDANVIYYITPENSVRSDNGGQTWLPLGDGLPNGQNQPLVMTVAFDPGNPLVLYAGTGGFVGQGQGVYKSTDGGETWSPSNKGMLDYRITVIAVDPKNQQVVYAGSDRGDLFKSNDAGQNWTNLKDRLTLGPNGEPREIRGIQIDAASGLVYLLGDNSGLLYSGDGGGKWRTVGIPPGSDQPRFQAMTALLGENPTFLISLMDQGGAWRFGPQP